MYVDTADLTISCCLYYMYLVVNMRFCKVPQVCTGDWGFSVEISQPFKVFKRKVFFTDPDAEFSLLI